MKLRNYLVRSGQVLFRFRSYLPVALLVGLVCLLWDSLPRHSAVTDYLYRLVAIGLTTAGVALRCATIGRIPSGTSGRNTKRQKASTLNTTGIYSVVRNPLYLANGLVWIGVTLLLEDPLLTGLFVVVLLAYYAIVVFTEQDYLSSKFSDEYTRYAAVTPALIPRLDRWQPSERPFSWRMVIRREHDSLFSVLTGLMLVFHCHDVITHRGHFLLRREWFIPWAVLGMAWLVLKVLKKRTCLLKVDPAPTDVCPAMNSKAAP